MRVGKQKRVFLAIALFGVFLCFAAWPWATTFQSCRSGDAALFTQEYCGCVALKSYARAFEWSAQERRDHSRRSGLSCAAEQVTSSG